MSALQWLTENYDVLLEGVAVALTVASFITALTKTPKDDSIVSKIRGWVDRLSLLVHKDADGTVKLPGAKSKR